MSSSNSIRQTLIAGGLSGIAVEVSLYPIDSLKTLLQLPGMHQIKSLKRLY